MQTRDRAGTQPPQGEGARPFLWGLCLIIRSTPVCADPHPGPCCGGGAGGIPAAEKNPRAPLRGHHFWFVFLILLLSET